MEKLAQAKLKNFKLKKTNKEPECTCSARYGELPIESVNVHFCHRLGEYHENGCKKTESHFKNHKCGSHWKKAITPKCCCGV